MLRVGLTGDLGSGKSTVARMLADRGAVVFSSDEMARAMMQPGQAVYGAIVKKFGPSILAADKTLDRRRLTALAFDPADPRVEDLNAIVHPAVIKAQAEQISTLARTNPHAIAVVESALIFSTKHAPEGANSKETWHSRFDCILLVTAPESEKIERFLKRVAAQRELSSQERASLAADARQRLALQHTEDHIAECMMLHNDRDVSHLEQQVEATWRMLKREEASGRR
jgi:dephospho-CoA kinase